MKQLFPIFCLLLAALTGCRKAAYDDPSGSDGEIAVRLMVNLGENSSPAESRGITDPVWNGSRSVFERGYLVFTDEDGAITKIFYILPSVAASGPGNFISIDYFLLATELELWVPSQSTRAAFLANLPGKVEIPVRGGNLSDIEVPAMSLSIRDQTDQTFDIQKASLYGMGMIISRPGVDPYYDAYIEVTPLISRIEIGSVGFEGERLTEGSAEGWLSGIFINNYLDSIYATRKIAGSIVHHGDDPLDYIPAGANYPASWEGYTYDRPDAPLNQGNGYRSVPPGTDKVWGLHVYSLIEIPHIVLSFQNVRDKEGSLLPGTLIDGVMYTYATIGGFIRKDTGMVITEFQPGYVYNLSDISLDESHLYPTPEPQFVTALSIEVEIADWVIHQREIGLE